MTTDPEELTTLGPAWSELSPLQKAQYGRPKSVLRDTAQGLTVEWSEEDLAHIVLDKLYFQRLRPR